MVTYQTGGAAGLVSCPVMDIEAAVQTVLQVHDSIDIMSFDIMLLFVM